MTSAGGGRPLTIAHRFGNDIARIREAEAAGVDLVEADVWLHRGRLQVRHEKSLGPLPFYWDRWSLRPAWRPVLRLDEMLAALAPRTGVMLDLKGRAPAFPEALLRALEPHDGERTFMVSARLWSYLPSLRALPHLLLFHSIGTEGQLERVRPLLKDREHDAVSIHYRLLNDETVAWLRDHVHLIATWPINDEGRLEQVLRWGIGAIIADDLQILGRVTGAPPRGAIRTR